MMLKMSHSPAKLSVRARPVRNHDKVVVHCGSMLVKSGCRLRPSVALMRVELLRVDSVRTMPTREHDAFFNEFGCVVSHVFQL